MAKKKIIRPIYQGTKTFLKSWDIPAVRPRRLESLTETLSDPQISPSECLFKNNKTLNEHYVFS